jgi:hypothetical protein
MSNPWKDLRRPKDESSVSALRVDVAHPWGFFWMRDALNRCGLLLQCSATAGSTVDPPAMHGISMGFLPDTADLSKGALMIRLNETENADLFLALCGDIVENARGCVSEVDAVNATIQRAWRWHYLLKKGRDARLSIEEQKGLMGEILFLERVLFPHLGIFASLNAWNGPFDAAQDFLIGAVAVEIKASRKLDGPVVAISSEFQLDGANLLGLFLGVVDLESTTDEDVEASSLSDMILRLGDTVRDDGPSSVDLWETRLLAAGYRATDQYTERWSARDIRLHRVTGSFPRLTPSTIPAAVKTVRYHLPVPSLKGFQIDEAVVLEMIRTQETHA